MANWKISAITSPGQDEFELTKAFGISFTFRLGPNAISEGSFSIYRKQSQSALLIPRETEILARRNGELLLRGPLMPTQSQDDGDGTSEIWQPRFVDLRSRFDSLFLLDSDCDKAWIVTTTGNPSSGYFTFSYGGQTTIQAPPNAAVGDLEAALQSLSTVGVGKVTVSGSIDNFTVVFAHNVNAPGVLTVNNFMTGNKITVNGAPTGGTFTVTYGANTTSGLAFNAAASVVETALNGLASIGAGGVSVSGGAGGPYTVSFAGRVARAAMSAASSLTGGTAPSVTVESVQMAVAPSTVTSVTFAGVDSGDIPRQVLAVVQAQPGANCGIVPASSPLPATGTTAASAFQVAQSFMACTDQIAQQTIGLEWDIIPLLPSDPRGEGILQTWPNGRGAVKPSNVVYSYPGKIVSYSRIPQTYANVVRATGGTAADGTELTPVTMALSDIATRPEGAWYVSVSAPDVTTQAGLVAFCAWTLNQLSSIPESLTCTLKDGSWNGPSDLWLGDTIPVVLRADSLQVNAPLRCVELDITLRDNGGRVVGEDVKPVFGRPRVVDYRNPFAPINRRLAVLERHT